MSRLTTVLNRHGVKIGLMLILVLLSLGGALGALSLYRRQTPPRQLVWKNSTNAESTDVQDQRPLREKARDAGQYKVTERPPDLSSFNNLDEVTRRSAAVVIATANRNVCSLSQNGKTVTIDYEMKVEHSYKGSLTPGQTISVSLPGGLTKFPDGTSAEIRTPWFKKMINGKTYLLAQEFPVQDKDVIFVADAPAAQVYKFFAALNNVTGPIITGLLTCQYAKC